MKIKKKKAELLRRRVYRHLRDIGFIRMADGSLLPPENTKETVRGLHANQKRAKLIRNRPLLDEWLPRLIRNFADGAEINPAMIQPELELVNPATWQSKLFRVASLTWSVPVSEGFGRRMRFLVWDRFNDKLIGIMALGDPVFNLRVRDNHVGWTPSNRKDHLVNLFDAFVLGAVPPYNQLLGGKLIACLVRTSEIVQHFVSRYSRLRGVISGKRKHPQLVMVTTSSSLGRSSVYARLSLNGCKYFEEIGFTRGWGHFHMPESIFLEMRKLLRLARHPYADNHKFGEGPNWRLRTLRAALRLLGMNDDCLKHGIERQVFVCSLAANAKDVLLGRSSSADYSSLLSVAEVAQLAKERWLVPRAERQPQYRLWLRENVRSLIEAIPAPQEIHSHRDSQAQ